MKLFEIPVYALSKEKLNERVDYAFRKFKSTYSRYEYDDNQFKKLFDIENYPARLWDYNHIIGYIAITKDGKDFGLDWYTIIPSPQKYYWNSRRKNHLQNARINGYHFYAGNMKTGKELQARLNDLVKGFVDDLRKRGYYADDEAFLSISNLLDYDALLKG